MKIGGLFEGYGGLTLGVQAALGGELAWYSEYEPPTEKNPRPTQAAARLLSYRHPGVPNLGDITTVDWPQVESVDVLCGGTPCQDVSSAGRRAGMRPGTRSGLWESMREAVAVLRPGLVVWENVRGVTSAEAHSDLEPGSGLLGAADGGPPLRALGRVLGDLADIGYNAQWCGLRAADVGAPHGRFRIFVVATDATGAVGRGRWPGHRAGDPKGSRRANVGGCDPVADPDSAGSEALSGRPWAGEPRRQQSVVGCGTDWGQYEPAIRRWERVLGRVAPPPTEPNSKGGQRLSPAFVEWMMGLPEGHVTDPALNLTRNEQLKVLGNGVVPQQAAAAILICLNRASEFAPTVPM